MGVERTKVAKFFPKHIPDLHTLRWPRPHNLYDYYLFSLFTIGGWGWIGIEEGEAGRGEASS